MEQTVLQDTQGRTTKIPTRVLYQEETKEEQWKPLKDFEYRYLVSDQGKVYDTQKDRLVKQITNGKNVPSVNLVTHHGVRLTKTLNKLVLASFTPKMEEDTKDVIYLDGNPMNCRLDNLQWKRRRTHEEALAYQREYERTHQRYVKVADRPPQRLNRSLSELLNEWNEELSHQLTKDFPQWLKMAIQLQIELNNNEQERNSINTHQT